MPPCAGGGREALNEQQRHPALFQEVGSGPSKPRYCLQINQSDSSLLLVGLHLGEEESVGGGEDSCFPPMSLKIALKIVLAPIHLCIHSPTIHPSIHYLPINQSTHQPPIH